MPKPTGSPGKGGTSGGKKTVSKTDKSNDGIIGTNDADHLVGTEGNDTIYGLGGDDILNGWTGHNVMDGGEGGDTYLVYGRGGLQDIDDSGTIGYDVIAAGTSSTSIALDGFGPDSGIEEITANGHAMVDICGSAQGDLLDFSTTKVDGIHMIAGMAGNDTIIGSDANDMIAGGADDDWLTGGLGTDTLSGGTGADTYWLDSNDDAVDVIKDFTVADGDKIDISSYAGDPSVVGWNLVAGTSDSGDPMAMLQILYEGGASHDVAEIMGLAEDQFDETAVEESILLF